MHPRSAAFDAAISSSHKVARVAQVTDFATSSVLTTLDITGGSVEVDATAAIRRQCQVTLADPTGSLTPVEATDLLATYGNELRLFRGVEYPDGSQELMPLGVFGISSVRTQDTGSGLVHTVTGYDRSRRIQRASLSAVLTLTAGGSTVAQTIHDLFDAVAPGMTYNLTTTGALTNPASYELGSDRWAIAQELAANIGLELFFDVNGVPTMRVIRDVNTTTIDYAYNEGAASVLVDVDREVTDEGVFNHVIVMAENSTTSPPVYGEAYDNNPGSPTYIHGPFGDVFEVVTNSYVTTAIDAASVAQGILSKSLGTAVQVSFDALVHPAHEAGDIVTIKRARAGLNGERHIIDTLTIPLDASTAMQANTRVGIAA